jgi:type VI secretion system secreted protein Hcp
MAFDAFLKLDGVPGESVDAKHKGEIEVLSFSWGATQPGVANGAPSRNAKAQIDVLTIIKRVDKASPKLILQSCGGNSLPNATLTVRKNIDEGQPSEFLKVKLSDVVISSLSAGGNGQTDQLPLEQLSLNFSKMEISVLSDAGEVSVGSCGPGFNK